ncbi:DUF6783 domain-containing protein [uncultured Robinsoniella sp.]
MRGKYTEKWGVQIAGLNYKIRSNLLKRAQGGKP